MPFKRRSQMGATVSAEQGAPLHDRTPEPGPSIVVQSSPPSPPPVTSKPTPAPLPEKMVHPTPKRSTSAPAAQVTALPSQSIDMTTSPSAGNVDDAREVSALLHAGGIGQDQDQMDISREDNADRSGGESAVASDEDSEARGAENDDDDDSSESSADEVERQVTDAQQGADGDVVMDVVGDGVKPDGVDPPEAEAEEDDDKATTADGSDAEDRPKPRKQIPTIRLTLSLVGTKTKMVEESITLLARAAGYDLPEDTAIGHGASLLPVASTSPPPPDTPLDPNAPKPKKKRRRRVLDRDEGYDGEDPFVDDSEAQVIEPKFYYAPERDGFFVSRGLLELKKGRTGRGRKPGSKNKLRDEGGTATILNVPGPSNVAAGSHLAPIVVPEDEGAHKATQLALIPRTREHIQVPDKEHMRALLKKAKPRESGASLGTTLKAALLSLKADVTRALPFTPKKFPPHLRPATIAVGQLALDEGEYDDVFFVSIGQIFPYNTFTIKKLIKRDILSSRHNYFNDQIDSRMTILKSLIDEATPAVVSDYERSLAEYQLNHKEWETRLAEKGKTLPDQTCVPVPASDGAGHVSASENVGGGNEGVPATIDDDKSPKPPTKNFRFGPKMREVYWEMLKLDEEMSDVIRDTQWTVERQITHTELNARKALYSRIVNLFPEGYMNSHRLSREMTVLKKRFEG